MSESNIVLCRIDNRLIHGQVATQWVTATGATRIVVANDDCATNKMRQGLMDMATPDGVTASYLTVQQTIEKLSKLSDDSRVFVLVETPADALALIEGGVQIPEVNVGIIHLREGKHQVTATVAVDDEDVAALKAIQDKGIKLDVRRVPSTPSDDVEKLFA